MHTLSLVFIDTPGRSFITSVARCTAHVFNKYCHCRGYSNMPVIIERNHGTAAQQLLPVLPFCSAPIVITTIQVDANNWLSRNIIRNTHKNGMPMTPIKKRVKKNRQKTTTTTWTPHGQQERAIKVSPDVSFFHHGLTSHWFYLSDLVVTQGVRKQPFWQYSEYKS
uniref:Uncharacterized protein TCIL3000_10_10270 n=1 Tax=Trypanosoma congolense (strain IL3000) TaxID=1068625 RepID=G0UXY1_TRYCI|nr:unnamed protein product [Trypanosoma congolense IL3000]